MSFKDIGLSRKIGFKRASWGVIAGILLGGVFLKISHPASKFYIAPSIGTQMAIILCILLTIFVFMPILLYVNWKLALLSLAVLLPHIRPHKPICPEDDPGPRLEEGGHLRQELRIFLRHKDRPVYGHRRAYLREKRNRSWTSGG